MNSTFVVISTLVKSNIEEKCLTKFLMNVSLKGLKDYLECASIYKGTSFKKKTDLIEMIVYGCMTGTINKKDSKSIKQANQILNRNNITIDSLPGYGNMGLKKKHLLMLVNKNSTSHR